MKCVAQTQLCSGELVQMYSVNGSEREGKTFALCGPCRVYLSRTARITVAKPVKSPCGTLRNTASARPGSKKVSGQP